MRAKQVKRSFVLGMGVLFLVLSILVVSATTGRIDEFRTQFRAEKEVPVFPNYVANVTYSDLLDHPTPDIMYSWAKDNEVWTAQFLETLRASGEQADELEKWIGDPILIVFIDFENEVVYSATFSLTTGAVLPEYKDTQTEVWASLVFIQELIVFGNENTFQDTVDFAVERYYEDWAIWVQKGFFDILLTREAVATLIAWGAVIGTGAFVYNKKKQS